MSKVLNKNFDEAVFLSSINSLDYTSLSDEELKSNFVCETSLEVKFAIIKEVIYRLKGLFLFNSQLLTAYYLLDGNIAELPTGEGKTLAAVVAAIVFCSNNHNVHIIVFNDYLAKRDCLNNKDIFEYFNFSSGFIEESTTNQNRVNIYKKNIVYLSVKEAGFDYLKDFLKYDKNEILFENFDIVIVDEADSIFLDEAINPLILAANSTNHYDNALKIDSIIKNLNESDYNYNKHKNQIWLTDCGISKLEKELKIDNLYNDSNTLYHPLIDASLQARFILKKDKDYVVLNDKISIVDQSTGRIIKNRKFPDFIQIAVEIKENLNPTNNTTIYNYMPIQSFLNLYPFKCGMTGTAKTSEKEFLNMYGLEVKVVKPHIDSIRKDLPFKVCLNKEEKERLVLEEIKASNELNRPVLLATNSVFESEKYQQLIQNLGLNCYVLNAKNNEEEANIISYAGDPKRITVSTNISGRGVDIKLGTKSKNDKELVLNAGGLYVISTYLNKSIRIDNQLRGRAGRQGDKGQSKFFVSLDDDIVKFNYDKKEINQLKKLVLLNDASSIKTLNNAIKRAQKAEEGKDAETRYMLYKYAAVLEQKREIVSNYRKDLLKNKTNPDILQKMDEDLYRELEKKYKDGVNIAQRQLLLSIINTNWSNYISAMNSIKEGIHFVIIGRKNPIDEYSLKAQNAFEEMMNDIKSQLVSKIKEIKIDENGIVFEKNNPFIDIKTTYTYLVDESKSQFNRMNEISSSISHSLNTFTFNIPIIKDKLKSIFKKNKR